MNGLRLIFHNHFQRWGRSPAKNEGETVTFTVTRSGSGTRSTVYLSTLNKSAMDVDDYIGFQIKRWFLGRTKKF